MGINPSPSSLFNMKQPEAIDILVYDNVGRIIKSGALTKTSSGKIKISLARYVSGTYFVKCFNSSFEKNFKVIKL